MSPPVPLGRSGWNMAGQDVHVPGDLIAVGADLEPSTLIEAYRNGLFPMPVLDEGDSAGSHTCRSAGETQLGWYSPNPRAIIEPHQLKISRSLARSRRRYQTTINKDFAGVIANCADPTRPGGWITPEVTRAYSQLHKLGWAHSVETWNGKELVGGLYGVQINKFFAGESMFQHQTDASKVALIALSEALIERQALLLDVQWITEHLQSLGAIELSRFEYLERLRRATNEPCDPISQKSAAFRGSYSPTAPDDLA